VEYWAEIRRTHRADGTQVQAIASLPGIVINPPRAALASDGASKFVRRPAGWLVASRPAEDLSAGRWQLMSGRATVPRPPELGGEGASRDRLAGQPC
jgi:hypothetical protein